MKFIKLLSLIAIFSAVLTSCNKESLTSVVDNTPEVEVIDETVTSLSEITVGDRSFSGTPVLASFVLDSTTMEINNYSLSFKSGTTGATQAVFAGAWDPLTQGELALQAATYSGFSGFSGDGFGSGTTMSQAGLDAFAAWQAAGADPATMPNLFDYITNYDASKLNYTISNITATTADVVVAGSMEDKDGNVVTVSGTFTADLEIIK